MGVIVLALVANGSLPAQDPGVPAWVVVAAASAIALGTYSGGWRIIRTLGSRVTEIQTPQAFSAETSAATVILAASNAGFPLSTTHVTSGSVLGSGLGRRAANVRWGVAGQMATAWVLTLPAATAMAAVLYLLTEVFDAGRHRRRPRALAAGALYAHTQRGAGRVTAGDVRCSRASSTPGRCCRSWASPSAPRSSWSPAPPPARC